jgi:hypothetical protein
MVIDLGLARSTNIWSDNLDTGKCRYRKEKAVGEITQHMSENYLARFS